MAGYVVSDEMGYEEETDSVREVVILLRKRAQELPKGVRVVAYYQRPCGKLDPLMSEAGVR